MAAPPQGKGSVLSKLETFSTPEAAPAKQRDMSRSSPAVPTPKQKNPDLGTQKAPGPAAVAPPAPTGPPVAPLQRYGVNMDINQVNDHVDQIVAAHVKAWGYKPTPGVIFDLLKSNNLITGKVGYDQLFGVPTSQRAAQADILARSGSGDSIASAPVLQPKVGDILKAVTKAAQYDSRKFDTTGVATNPQTSMLHQLLMANKADIDVAMDDPKERDILAKGLMKVYQTSGQVITQHDAAGILGNTNAVKLDAFLKPAAVAMRAVTQIVGSTPDMPFGFYQLVRGAGLDVFDLSTIPLHSLGQNTGLQNFGLGVRARPLSQATHTSGLVVRMGQQVIQDVQDPINRPGYLAMDIWAGLTLGAGTASRLSAATRAEGVAATTRALVFKAPPSASEVGFASYEQSLPLSDTTSVRWFQENFPGISRNSRQARFEAEQTHGYDDTNHEKLVDSLMPLSKTIARQAKSDMQIQQAIALTPLAEMNKLTRADAWMKGVISEYTNDWRGSSFKGIAIKHKLGVEKAIQLVFSDDPDPVAMWRNYHEGQIQSVVEGKANHAHDFRQALLNDESGLIDEGNVDQALSKHRGFNRGQSEFEYSFQAHKAQLEAIDLAEQILENPPARLKPLINRAREVTLLKEQWQQEMTGTAQELLDQHVARVAGFGRGQRMIDLGGGKLGYSEVDPGPLLAQIEKRTKKLTRAKDRLTKAEGTLRFHPDREDFQKRVADAQAMVDRHNKKLGAHEQALQDIKDAATPVERQITPETDFGRDLGPVDERVAALREGTAGSAHVPMPAERYRHSSGKRFSGGKTKFGLGPVELEKPTWTGDSVEVGDYRIDISALLNEQVPGIYRAFTKRASWQKLWDASVESPITNHHTPIRDIKSIPDELRKFIEGVEKSKADPRYADMLSDKHMDELMKLLYPNIEDVRSGTIPAKHVRYVDSRLVVDSAGKYPTETWQNIDQIFSHATSWINDPMRFFLIYGTPAYALNALGSAALLTIHTGFLAPQRLMRSMRAEQIYGPEIRDLLDRLSGQTHASALQTEKTWWSKAPNVLQESWGLVTDTWFRRGAVIHELKRHGLLDENMSNDEILAALKDSANAKKVNQAAQTARKAMIDFNSLTWPERAILRHIVFVYSFVRGSGIWSLRYLRDHGFQSDVLAQSGRNREQNIDTLIGHMPDWFMRSGYFAVHPDVIYNPIQWNMPGMLSQILTPLASIFGHVPYSSSSELWGPAATAASETATGVDPQGRALTHNTPFLGSGNFSKAMYQLYQQTFVGQIASKHEKAAKEQPLKPPGIHSSFTDPITPALQREKSGVNQSVFELNGFWNTWGLAAFRSGITRGVNSVAGEARYWRDLRTSDPAAYHKHEITAVIQMVKRQQGVVGKPAPSEVIRSVETIAHVSQAIYDFQAKHKGELQGHSPNDKQLAQITLDTLVQEGHLKKADWEKNLRAATDPAVIKAMRIDMLLQAGGTAWRDWVTKVNAIDAYAQPKADVVFKGLSEAGFGDFSKAADAPQKDRWAYGRQAEALLEKSKELSAQVTPSDEASLKRQEWVQFVNENDKPIVINGTTFPSPFAYEYGSKTPAEQQKALARIAARKPSTMTALQYNLLTGQRPDPVITKAWETLYGWLRDAKAKLPFGEKLTSGTKAYWEDYVASKVPEFKAVLDADRAPLAKRLSQYKPITASKNASAWSALLSTAGSRYDQLAKSYVNDDGKPVQSLITQAWKDYDVPKVKEWLTQTYGAGFTSEVQLYTGFTPNPKASAAVNATNADQALTNFIGRLITP